MLAARSREQVEESFRLQLRSLFGPNAADPCEVVLVDWCLEGALLAGREAAQRILEGALSG